MTLTTENVAIYSFLFVVVSTIAKKLWDKIGSFTNNPIYKKANEHFFIPSYYYFRKILFEKVTSNNFSDFEFYISFLNQLLKVPDTRYYLPEDLAFLIDDLSSAFKAPNRNYRKINRIYQKFSKRYFFYYNLYKGSIFNFEFSITKKHKFRKFLIRLSRLVDFFIIVFFAIVIILLSSYFAVTLIKTMNTFLL